jgi:hypothetical protein
MDYDAELRAQNEHLRRPAARWPALLKRRNSLKRW